MQGQYDPVPREPPPPPRMEGFGSAEITTPLYYGSVNDGRLRNEGLEHKLQETILENGSRRSFRRWAKDRMSL